MMHEAIVIGATGLVGRSLCEQLIADKRFSKVKIFTRRSAGFSDDKIEETIIDFNSPGQWQQLVTGDVIFSCLGTTIKKAGSKDAQYKIDYTYQYEFAKAAAANKVKKLVLVSSAGANEKSKMFYSQMKGELDNEVKKLGFEAVSIIKSSVLDGKRDEKRNAEKGAIIIGRFLTTILPFLSKYRPIKAEIVAKAMINAAVNNNSGIFEYELGQVFELAESSV